MTNAHKHSRMTKVTVFYIHLYHHTRPSFNTHTHTRTHALLLLQLLLLLLLLLL